MFHKNQSLCVLLFSVILYGYGSASITPKLAQWNHCNLFGWLKQNLIHERIPPKSSRSSFVPVINIFVQIRTNVSAAGVLNNVRLYRKLSDTRFTNGNSEKISGKKIVKKNRASTFEWKLGGGGRSGPAADRLLLLLLLALYLHFFPRTRRRRHVYFSSFFFFSGNRRALPPHMCPWSIVHTRRELQSTAHTANYSYAMSTSGRTFKLALIKYWLRVVFFINRWAFLRDSRPIQYQCESAVLLICSGLGRRLIYKFNELRCFLGGFHWLRIQVACYVQ